MPHQNTAIIQERDKGGLNQGSDDDAGDDKLESSQVLRIEPTRFADRLDVNKEKEKNQRVFCKCLGGVELP